MILAVVYVSCLLCGKWILSPEEARGGFMWFLCGGVEQSLLVMLYLFVKGQKIILSFFYTKGVRQPGNINFRSVWQKKSLKDSVTYSPFVNCMAIAVSFMPFSLCISHWFEKGEHLRDREGMTSEWRFTEQINGCIRIMVGNLINFTLITPGSPFRWKILILLKRLSGCSLW